MALPIQRRSIPPNSVAVPSSATEFHSDIPLAEQKKIGITPGQAFN